MTADELKALRKRLGWSQSEAAEHLGCSRRSIVNWEGSIHKIPNYIDLAASAVLLNLPPYGTK